MDRNIALFLNVSNNKIIASDGIVYRFSNKEVEFLPDGSKLLFVSYFNENLYVKYTHDADDIFNWKTHEIMYREDEQVTISQIIDWIKNAIKLSTGGRNG